MHAENAALKQMLKEARGSSEAAERGTEAQVAQLQELAASRERQVAMLKERLSFAKRKRMRCGKKISVLLKQAKRARANRKRVPCENPRAAQSCQRAHSTARGKGDCADPSPRRKISRIGAAGAVDDDDPYILRDGKGV